MFKPSKLIVPGKNGPTNTIFNSELSHGKNSSIKTAFLTNVEFCIFSTFSWISSLEQIKWIAFLNNLFSIFL